MLFYFCIYHSVYACSVDLLTLMSLLASKEQESHLAYCPKDAADGEDNSQAI